MKYLLTKAANDAATNIPQNISKLQEQNKCSAPIHPTLPYRIFELLKLLPNSKARGL